MAKINVAIQNRFFEIIRDRLATILADEIANQAAINYDENLDATVFTDRFIPIDQSEMPCVVVGIAEGDFDNYTQLAKDGNYNFTVDVYHRSPTTIDNRGDQLSNRKLQRLVGVIDYILSDPIYRTLGIKAPSISRVEVQGFQIANPTDEQRSKNVSMARMRVLVRANETVAGIEPILLAGYQTNVKIGATEYGYIFSGTAPFTPAPPACAPANIFNTDKSFDIEVDSGASYEIPDITVTDSDGSTFEWPAVKDVTCTFKGNGTVTIKDDSGTLLYTLTVPPNSTLNQVIQDAIAVLKDTAGNTLGNFSINAEGSLDIVAPDGSVSVENTDGTEVDSGTVLSGGSSTFLAPDADISLNGEAFPSIPSGTSDNIQVRQSSGSTQIGSRQGQHFRIPDSVITLNTNEVTENVLATDSKNFNLLDSDGNPIAVDSVSGDDVTLDAEAVSTSFIIKVVTQRAGTSNDNQFTIPTRTPFYTYDYNVETSDGQTFTGQTGDLTITFPNKGVYTINILENSPAGFPSIYFNNGGDRLKLLEVMNWGTNKWQGLTSSFRGCTYCDVTAKDTPDLSLATQIDNFALSNSNFYTSSFFANTDTSNITVFTQAFRSSLISVDLSTWDVSSGVILNALFTGAPLFDFNLGSWQLSNSLVLMDRIFASSGMSTENYTDTIVGWANYVFDNGGTPSTVDMSNQSGMTFDTSRSGGANFADAGAARTYLTGTALWTISGDTII